MESQVPLPELKYVMFENKSNNCWLDASMVLVAHNKAIKLIAGCSPNSKLHEVISLYSEAVSILNDSSHSLELRIKTAKEKLHKLQIRTLHYLQPMLKCQNGEPDSAFCALLSLIYENKSIKENLSITWLWKKKCLQCNTSKLTQSAKPIITLSKVNYFVPDCPTSIYQCSCKTEQEMKLIYKELPPCIIFHFENGAGTGDSPPLLFVIQDRKYQLTGVITLEKGEESTVNHFITWIRDPTTNKWLECNDLNMDIVSFSTETPEINLKDVYIYVYESFDNIGKMHIEVSTEFMQEQDCENTNVELIDLSDESEDAKPVELLTSEVSKEEKLDTSEEKSIPELNKTENLGAFKETETQELNSLCKEKMSTIQVPKRQKTTLEDYFDSPKKSPISKAEEGKQSSSFNNNVLAKDDDRKTLPSKVNEEIIPKMRSKKGIIKNFHVTYGNKYAEEKCITASPLLKKWELQSFSKVENDAESKEKNQMTCSGENPNTESKEDNCMKNTVTSLIKQRKNELQVHSPDASSMLVCKSDNYEKLSSAQSKIPTVKNMLTADEKDGCSVVGDLNPIQETEEKVTVNKNKLPVTCTEKNQGGQMISNTSADVINLSKVCEHLDVFSKTMNKMKIDQSNTSVNQSDLSKIHENTMFLKEINKTDTLQDNKCGMQLEENALMNPDIERTKTSSSSSVKSSFEKKRKYSSQYSVPENSNEKLAVPSKKFQKEILSKNEFKDAPKSQIKIQRTSSRKPCKNKRYMTDYLDDSSLKASEAKIRRENASGVSGLNKKIPATDKIILQNQKQPTDKNSKKPRKTASDRKLDDLIDDVVERTFAAFLEQVFRKKNIDF